MIHAAVEQTPSSRLKSAMDRIEPFLPWLLLEVLAAVVFMAVSLGLTVEESGHEIDLDTMLHGLAYGAVVGGVTLAIVAFTVAVMATLIDGIAGRSR